jgi:hypothetical protein
MKSTNQNHNQKKTTNLRKKKLNTKIPQFNDAHHGTNTKNRNKEFFIKPKPRP